MVSGSHTKIELKKVLPLIRNLLGVAVLIFLVYYVGVNDIFNSIRSIKVYYLPVIFGLYILFLCMSTLCIQILIKKKTSFKKMFKYCSLSWVFGLVIPGKLGELSLAFLLKKEGFNFIPSLVISFIDKFLTLLFLIIISFFGVFLFFDANQSLYFIIITSLIIGCFYLFFNIKLLQFFIPKKYRKYSNEFIIEYSSFFKKERKRLYFNFLLTILRWLINSFMVFFIFLSLGITINIFYILIINTLTAFTSLIPLTVNGLGIRQSLGVYLFSKINVSSSLSLNMYLISLSLTYFIALALYSYYSYFDGSEVKPT